MSSPHYSLRSLRSFAAKISTPLFIKNTTKSRLASASAIILLATTMALLSGCAGGNPAPGQAAASALHPITLDLPPVEYSHP